MVVEVVQQDDQHMQATNDQDLFFGAERLMESAGHCAVISKSCVEFGFAYKYIYLYINMFWRSSWLP